MFNIFSFFKKSHAIGKNGARKQSKWEPASVMNFVDKAGRSVSTSTRENYKTAVRSFVRFNGGKDMALSVMDRDLMRQYERWLHENGVCPNTSSCYMRSLRALYNKAVAKRLVKNKAPFRDVFTGNDKTEKRSISSREICKLRQLDLSDSIPLALTRDLFLFSFYAMGIPFIDMAHLTKSRIKGDMLVYYRHKTGRRIQVKLEPCMLIIISRYEREDSNYIFPILYKVEDGRLVKRSYHSALNEFNRKLKTLARSIGSKARITSYVARHSWASVAYQNNVDLPIISKALGHSTTQTTLIYINEIDDKRMAQANNRLLMELFGRPLGKRRETKYT